MFQNQAITIKQEPTNRPNGNESHVFGDSLGSSVNTALCTCGPKLCSSMSFHSKASVTPKKKKKSRREILVNFGLNRKKVITLKSKKDSLTDLFSAYVVGEPAFSKLMKDSYVVFQEFSSKFGTWVDIDTKLKLPDGAVVKAVFFPIAVERDEVNPGSVKKKEKGKYRTTLEEKEIVEIDLSTDSDKSAQVFNSSNVSSESDVEKVVRKLKQKKLKEMKEKKKKSLAPEPPVVSREEEGDYNIADFDGGSESQQEEEQPQQLEEELQQEQEKEQKLPLESDNSDVEVKFSLPAESVSSTKIYDLNHQLAAPPSPSIAGPSNALLAPSVPVHTGCGLEGPFTNNSNHVRTTSVSNLGFPASTYTSLLQCLARDFPVSPEQKRNGEFNQLEKAKDIIPLKNNPSCRDIPSLFKTPSSGKFSASHVFSYIRDPVKSLQESCVTEIVSGPIYSFANSNYGCTCKVMANGSFYVGRGLSIIEAKKNAALKALEAVFPHRIRKPRDCYPRERESERGRERGRGRARARRKGFRRQRHYNQ